MNTVANALSERKGPMICSLNIRSIYRSLDELSLLLQDNAIDVMLLQESFLNDSVSDAQLEIVGYNLHRFDRQATSGKSAGGGLCAYSAKS